MKLWKLSPRIDLSPYNNPWVPWYDKCFGMVVRAEDELSARKIAHEFAGDENCKALSVGKISNTKSPWKNSKYSICTELLQGGISECIIRDIKAA